MTETFGKALIRLRLERNLSQVEMATAANIPLQNYRLYERDKFYPKAYTLLRLAVIFQIDPFLFASLDFKGQGIPIEGVNASKSMLKRVYGETKTKGINKVNSKKIGRLAKRAKRSHKRLLAANKR